MSIVKSEIAVCHDNGITLLSLEIVMCKDIVENMVPRTCYAYKNGLLFTCKDDQKVYFWKDERVETFAGSGEKGSRDGTLIYAQFHTPTGLCVEFDHVVYVADYRFGSIRQITTLKHTASFLRALNKLIDAFSIHDKHRNYTEKTLEEAICLVSDCVEVMTHNIGNINDDHSNLPKKLNDPEGSISAKTYDSLKLLLWGLQQVHRNAQHFKYNDVSLLSCMTLDIENLHSTVNMKHGTHTMLQYARSFATSIKESVKSLVTWSAHYFTGSKRWYPLSENNLALCELHFPAPLSPAVMSDEERFEMREWASMNGAVVRQRSTRQETTMAKAGTLPEAAYRSLLQPSNSELEDPFDDQEITENEDEAWDNDDDEVLEFDGDGDSNSESSDEEGNTGIQSAEIGREATFLIGQSSRYGRVVRLNNRFIS